MTPSGSCAAMVREGYERMAAEAGDEPLAAEVRALAPRVFELSEFLVGELGVEDVGAAFPHRVTYHPTCHSLRLLQVGDAPVRLLRAVRGHRPGRAARRRAVLRLRRHLRGQERRHLDGDADRQAAAHPRHRRRRLHGGRQLVPDAHRRRPAPRARGRARHAPRRDPGQRGRREGPASRGARAHARWPTASCGATSATRRRRSATSARGWSPRCPTGRRCATPARRSRTRALRHLDVHLERLEEAVQRAGGTVHWARDGAEADRGGGRRRRAPTASDEVIKVKSLATDEIDLNDAPRGGRRARRGDRSGRADHPALRRHVLAHPRPRHPPQPRRRSRDALPARAGRRGLRRARRADRGGARAPARAVPLGAASASAAPTSPSPRPATWCVVESEGNGRMCTTLPEVLVSVVGIEKVLPALRATWRSCSSCCRAPRRASG